MFFVLSNILILNLILAIVNATSYSEDLLIKPLPNANALFHFQFKLIGDQLDPTKTCKT